MEIIGTVSMILSQKGSMVWSITPDATVYEAIELMAANNIGALPVLDGNRLAGLISERDYTQKVILKGRSSKHTPVAEIMTRDIITASADDAVAHCMEMMTLNRIRHLPIVDGDELVGILSIGDVVKWIMSAQAAAIHHLQQMITGEYPA